jgi:hypothetical protein
MKYAVWLIFLLCALPTELAAQIGIYQHGSVVRMHMGDCALAPHGFMTTFGAPSGPESQDVCPQYTLVSDKVVYVIVGKSSNELIPLAETVDFRLHKNELAVRVDDAKHESKFAIKEMMFRADWERMQRHIDEQIKDQQIRDQQIREGQVRASEDHDARSNTGD